MTTRQEPHKTLSNPDRRGFRIEEVAEAYGLSRSKIYEEMENGRLASIKMGKSRRILPRHLDAWEKEHETAKQAPE